MAEAEGVSSRMLRGQNGDGVGLAGHQMDTYSGVLQDLLGEGS